MIYSIHADDELLWLTSGNQTADELLDQVRFGARSAEVRSYQLGDGFAAQLADPAGRTLTGGDGRAFVPCPAAARLLARFGHEVVRRAENTAQRRNV